MTRRLLRLADAVAAYREHRGTLVAVMAWSIVVQLLRIVQAWLLGLGLGLTVPFSYYLLFMPLGLLALLLPISVSGFGVPQGVIVWLLRPVGRARRGRLRAVDADRAHRAGRQPPRALAVPARPLGWPSRRSERKRLRRASEPRNAVESIL